jgi:hypothetical protein
VDAYQKPRETAEVLARLLALRRGSVSKVAVEDMIAGTTFGHSCSLPN